MPVVGTLNVSGAGMRRPSSIEDKIRDGDGTLISATMVRKLSASRAVPQQTRTSGGGRADHFKAVSLQTHFWVRNAPYAAKDRGNPLKSQRMRPPSERTTPSISSPMRQTRAGASELCRHPMERFGQVSSSGILHWNFKIGLIRDKMSAAAPRKDRARARRAARNASDSVTGSSIRAGARSRR